MISSYKDKFDGNKEYMECEAYEDKSDRNKEYMECEKDNNENGNHQWQLKNEMQLRKSQQNMEVCKSRLNDCQKEKDRYEEENKELRVKVSNCTNCQHLKDTCIESKDACQKNYEKCKEENKKLKDEKFDCIYCQHSKDTCVQDKDACTQQLKEKKIKHEECLSDKENINEQMHIKCSEYQIKLTKCESNLQHTINDLGHCEKKLGKKTWF